MVLICGWLNPQVWIPWIWRANCIYSKEIKTCPHKTLYMNICSSIIHNIPKAETANVHQLMNGETKCSISIKTEYYSAIKKNEVWILQQHSTVHHTVEVCYNIDERWKHYSKQQYTVTKDHILWFHLHEVFKIDKSTETEHRLVFTRGWGGVTVNGYRVSLLGWWEYSNTDIADKGLHNYEYTKLHWTVLFKGMNFMQCELYLN